MKPILSIFLSQNISETTARHLLPWYEKLADNIIQSYQNYLNTIPLRQKTFLVAISGSQGSGKSTLASVLPTLLKQKAGLHADGFSIDDVYKTKHERSVMAKDIHPLFATRGAPGTHDLQLADHTIAALLGGFGQIPSFDKSADDRCPQSTWRVITEPSDIVIVEGWCMACPPEKEDKLATLINRLEIEEDIDGIWRSEINHKLKTDYYIFFSRFNYLVTLAAPTFESVFSWRKLQEEKLRLKNPHAISIMGEKELTRFIEHYERLTRHMLKTLPEISDATLQLNDQHEIVDCFFRSGD